MSSRRPEISSRSRPCCCIALFFLQIQLAAVAVTTNDRFALDLGADRALARWVVELRIRLFTGAHALLTFLLADSHAAWPGIGVSLALRHGFLRSSPALAPVEPSTVRQPCSGHANRPRRKREPAGCRY